jgi:hypothetical protein
VTHFLPAPLLVDPGDGAQPTGDGGPGAAASLQIACEALDVGAAGLEQVQVILLAPVALSRAETKLLNVHTLHGFFNLSTWHTAIAGVAVLLLAYRLITG